MQLWPLTLQIFVLVMSVLARGWFFHTCFLLSGTSLPWSCWMRQRGIEATLCALTQKLEVLGEWQEVAAFHSAEYDVAKSDSWTTFMFSSETCGALRAKGYEHQLNQLGWCHQWVIRWDMRSQTTLYISHQVTAASGLWSMCGRLWRWAHLIFPRSIMEYTMFTHFAPCPTVGKR